MLGIITTSTIEKYHRLFDELGYPEDELATKDSFVKASINTLNHTKDLEAATDVVCLIRECLDNWGTIEKIFKNKLDVWKQYVWEGPQDIKLEENNDGVSYVTNAFSPTGKDFYYTSTEFGDEYMEILEDKNVWVAQIDSNPSYYIVCHNRYPYDVDFYKYSSDRLVATLTAGDVFYLEDNKMKIDINAPEDEDYISVFPREYLDSLNDGDALDAEKMLFGFEFDNVDEQGKCCVARIENYAPNDIDIQAYLAIAFIVTTRRRFKYLKKKMNTAALGGMATIGALNSIRPH